MVTYEEALSLMLNKANLLEEEKVELYDASNRVLSANVYSDINMPPFDKSAVDGYACRSVDINEELEIIEIIQAGQTPRKKIGKNQCSQIMTGAPVPDGADKIIMVEHVEKSDNKIKALKNQKKSNICQLSEDVSIGQEVLKKSTLIKPEHIAVLASVGCSNVPVYKQPKVAVLSTGDEIVEPNVKPGKSQIRNSNGAQLIAQINNIGLNAYYYGIIEDSREHTFKKITQALEENDIILLTGGVSMGEYDFVPEVLQNLGIKIHFNQVQIKPGKPTVFGTIENKSVFGLPGNPVSSFVLFEILVKPYIYKLMNHDFTPKIVKMPLGVDYKRARTGRKSFIPVYIKDNKVFPVEYHGSGHIHSLVFADGLISVSIGVSNIEKEDLVDVRYI